MGFELKSGFLVFLPHLCIFRQKEAKFSQNNFSQSVFRYEFTKKVRNQFFGAIYCLWFEVVWVLSLNPDFWSFSHTCAFLGKKRPNFRKIIFLKVFFGTNSQRRSEINFSELFI